MTKKQYTIEEIQAIIDAESNCILSDASINCSSAQRDKYEDPVHKAKHNAAAVEAGALRKGVPHPKTGQALASHIQRSKDQSTDPAWIAAVAAGNQKKATDPKWLTNNAKAAAKRSQDPVWQEMMQSRNAVLSTNSNWLIANTAAAKKRAVQPELVAQIYNECWTKIRMHPRWKELGLKYDLSYMTIKEIADCCHTNSGSKDDHVRRLAQWEKEFGNVGKWQTPTGIFDSIDKIAEAAGCSASKIKGWIKYYPTQYYKIK
jgi:hypothetical protein